MFVFLFEDIHFYNLFPLRSICILSQINLILLQSNSNGADHPANPHNCLKFFFESKDCNIFDIIERNQILRV